MTSIPTSPWDLDHFYIKSSDDQGHGQKISARVPSGITRAAELILASKQFPYLEAISDLVRDGFYREVLFLGQNCGDGKIKGVLAGIKAAQVIIEEELARSKIEDMVKNTDETFMNTPDEYRKKQKAEEVTKALSSGGDDYWNRQALKALHRRLPTYFKESESSK